MTADRNDRSPRAAFAAGAALALAIASASPAMAQDPVTFTVVGWNVESGGADPATIAGRIGAHQGCDVWGLSEVANAGDARRFADAAGRGEDRDGDGEDDAFEAIVGTTGGGDRLAIVYNTNRLELIGHSELHQINALGTHRSPLVAHFRGRDVPQEFLFMVNHLARRNRSARHSQAGLLNAWAADQTLPVIAVGDYNFDFDIDPPNRRDRGFDAMTAGGVFTWIEPQFLVKTQAAPQFNSILNFVFVSRPAFGWAATSVILVSPGDFPDDNRTSDHRPVLATFELAAMPDPAPPDESSDPRRRILDRVESLERELQEIKRLLRELGPTP